MILGLRVAECGGAERLKELRKEVEAMRGLRLGRPAVTPTGWDGGRGGVAYQRYWRKRL